MDDWKVNNSAGLDQVQLQAVVLGALLSGTKQAGAVFAALGAEDFSSTWRTMYEALRELHFDGQPIDRVSLLHKLGEDYAEAIDAALRWAPKADPLPYCQMLHERATMERMRGEALSVMHAETYDEAVAAAQRLIGLLSGKGADQTISIQDAVTEFFSDLDRLGGEEIQYLDWGLDYMTSALDTELGDYVVIGGYPSAGKTLLALQAAEVIAKTYRVGFYSVETNRKKVRNRLISTASGVELKKIKHNTLREADYRALNAAGERLYMRQMDITQAAGWTVDEIFAEALNKRQQVIFVDYLQIVEGAGRTPVERVTEISKRFHVLAQKHGILTVLLSQLNRPEKADKNGRFVQPGMANLRESGQIEQDADAILLLYRENPEDPKNTNRILKIAKNKEGEPIRPATLALDGARQRFSEVFPEYKPAPKTNKKPVKRDEQTELPL